jgi:LPXTG-motif cell wall-anchored protein
MSAIDLQPTYENGTLMYVEPQSVSGLGSTDSTASGIKSAGALIAAASPAFGLGAPVVAAIGGIVAGIGSLVGSIFGTAKIDALHAQQSEVDAATLQVKMQNAQLDSQILNLHTKTNELRQILGLPLSGLNGGGLGCFIFGCAKEDAEHALGRSQDAYKAAIAAQADKIDLATKLTDEVLALINITGKNKQALYIIGGAALLIGGYLYYKGKKKAAIGAGVLGAGVLGYSLLKK